MSDQTERSNENWDILVPQKHSNIPLFFFFTNGIMREYQGKFCSHCVQ